MDSAEEFATLLAATVLDELSGVTPRLDALSLDSVEAELLETPATLLAFTEDAPAEEEAPAEEKTLVTLEDTADSLDAVDTELVA